MSDAGYAGDVMPDEAWKMLETDPKAVLVDVRTPAEWSYVGVPDPTALGRRTVFVPWQLYPTMQVNEAFASQLVEAGVGPDATVLFLCRSGVRSRHAAVAMTGLGYRACYNIAQGFEGDMNADKHRGTVGGWKVTGLPWTQS